MDHNTNSETNVLNIMRFISNGVNKLMTIAKNAYKYANVPKVIRIN
jgi:hypothetical protein